MYLNTKKLHTLAKNYGHIILYYENYLLVIYNDGAGNIIQKKGRIMRQAQGDFKMHDYYNNKGFYVIFYHPLRKSIVNNE